MPSIIKVDQIQSDTGTVNLSSNVAFTGTNFSVGGPLGALGNKFEVQDASSSVMEVRTTSGGRRIRLQASDSAGALIGTSSNHGITFMTNNTGRLSIPADAAGITFPASQAASSDPNTLDDYEEGTWTPGISGRTFSNVFGMYRKIGSCVYVYGDCNGINSSITDPELTGLPFASTNSSSAQYGGYFAIPEPAGWTLSSGYAYLYYRVNKNSTSGLFLQGDGRNHTSGTSIGTSGNFRFSGFYFTD